MADLTLVPPTPPIAVPKGWKLVPIEPTNAMLAAAIVPWRNDPAKKSSTIYTAMVNAAPAYGAIETAQTLEKWLDQDASGVPPCHIDEFSSRMCERGTKGCTVTHGVPQVSRGTDGTRNEGGN